jgi:hypothetical protein
MSHFLCLSNRAIVQASLLIACLVAAGAQAWSAPINNPGAPAACLPAGSRNNAAKPGQVGYAVSGPVDTDPLSPVDNTDPTIDMCITFYFSVPEVANAFGKTSGGLDGWGALVLDFSAPIDGASFIFDPSCPTTVQGTLNTAQVISGVDGSVIAPNTMVQLVPAVTGTGGAGYQLPETSTFNSDGVEYQQLAVTIMYDTNSKNDGSGNPLPVPTIVPGQSFWQSKPKLTTTRFTYVPPGTNPTTGKPLPNTDMLMPEPSFWPALLAVLVLLIATRRRPEHS